MFTYTHTPARCSVMRFVVDTYCHKPLFCTPYVCSCVCAQFPRGAFRNVSRVEPRMQSVRACAAHNLIMSERTSVRAMRSSGCAPRALHSAFRARSSRARTSPCRRVACLHICCIVALACVWISCDMLAMFSPATTQNNRACMLKTRSSSTASNTSIDRMSGMNWVMKSRGDFSAKRKKELQSCFE